MKAASPISGPTPRPLEQRVADLLGSMTLLEKIGQMNQVNGTNVRLAVGESRTPSFELCSDDLTFYGRKMQLMVEAGDFHV